MYSRIFSALPLPCFWSSLYHQFTSEEVIATYRKNQIIVREEGPQNGNVFNIGWIDGISTVRIIRTQQWDFRDFKKRNEKAIWMSLPDNKYVDWINYRNDSYSLKFSRWKRQNVVTKVWQILINQGFAGCFKENMWVFHKAVVRGWKWLEAL